MTSLLACSRHPEIAAPDDNHPAIAEAAPESAAAPAIGAPLELVESWPVETSLDRPRVRDTAGVWLEMIDGAEASVDLGEFYVATAPDSPLEPILAAIEAAAARGVRVRLLIDAKFYAKQPEGADRLAAIAGVEVRKLDLSALGGVMHAKYFVVDGREAYLGSANFDWRSLAHIHELGVRLREPALVAGIAALFAHDWAEAGADDPAAATWAGSPGGAAPTASLDYGGAAHRITLVASPEALLPDPSWWDLPRLIALIDGATARVQLQLLSYAIVGYDGERFTAIDDALRAAAARGVEVELLVADWNKRPPAIEDLQALQRVPGITVRMATIPAAAAGFIPFARVIHSKAMTVDGRAAWVGTSNFSGDYFARSRNLGVIVEGEAFAADVSRVFAGVWGSAYVYDVDPEATYEPPQVGPPPSDAPAKQRRAP
ncbi:MAG: phospholipase D-like domain-containing protein [Nannocystaceae bacterium]